MITHRALVAVAFAIGVPAASAQTYTKDVAPVLYARCASCHRPTQMAPMSLLTYEEVRPWAKSIKQRVVKREMPPWFADFNWQLSYVLETPRALPKGTRVECVAHFDNSSRNPANPDPNAEVRWGDQTWEEMMIGFYTFTRDAEPAVTAGAREEQ